MKIVKYLLSAAALLSLGACNHEGDEIVIAQTEPAFAAHADVVVNKSTEAEDFTLVWSPAKFGYKTDVEYTVGAEYGEQSLSLGTTSETYFSTTNSHLFSSFGIEEAGEYAITFNLSAVTPAGETAAAKPMVVKFVYDIPVVVEEAYLYIAGDYQGWDPALACSRLKLNANNVYEGLLNLPEGGTYEFKFCAQQSWDGPNYGLKDGVLSTEADAGNFKADAAGLYYIVFDAVNATVEMTPITYVGLIGDAVGGWDTDKAQFEFDAENNVWVANAPVESGKNFKIRFNQVWDLTDLGGDVADLQFKGSDIAATETGSGVFTLNIFDFPYTLNVDVTPGEGPVTPEPEPEPTDGVYHLVGGFNGWDIADTTYEFTEAASNGYLTVKNVAMTMVDYTVDGEGWKIAFNHNWSNPNYSSEGLVELGVPTLFKNTSLNSGLAAEGNYDFYFNPTTKYVIVVEAGAADPTGGSTPEPEPAGDVYHLVGAFNGWDIADTTYEFKEAANNGYLTLKNVAMTNAVNFSTDGFKVGFNHNWDVSYTAEAALALGVPTMLKNAFGNTGLPADGNYDFYFNPETKYIIVVEAGAADPTGGSTPEPDEPEEHEGFRIYVENKAGYSPLYAYVWTDGGENLFGAWPGTQLSNYEDIDGKRYYYADLGAEHADKKFQIIFNNNAGQQTPNSEVFTLNKDFFFVAEKGAPAYEANTTPVIPTFYVAGDCTGWGDIGMTDLSETVHVLKEMQFAANQGFKVKYPGTWDNCYGAPSTSPITIGSAFDAVQPGENVTIGTAGTYDIYFNSATKKICVVNTGAASPF